MKKKPPLESAALRNTLTGRLRTACAATLLPLLLLELPAAAQAQCFSYITDRKSVV